MTPEELNRTVEFIIQSQARLAAAQEQDRIDRLQSQKEGKAFDARLAGLLEIQIQLLESQTRRMDEFQRESQAAQKRHEETHQQMREEFWADERLARRVTLPARPYPRKTGEPLKLIEPAS
jgi:hypothetical protein